MPSLHVVASAGQFDPCIAWIDEAWSVVENGHPEFADWQLGPIMHADARSSFRFLDVYAVVSRSPGPTLFVGSLRAADMAAFEEKAAGRFIVRRCLEPASSTDIYEAMLDCLARHALGEPEVPRRLAVALMLVAKLEKMHYWGGNAKNFMSVMPGVNYPELSATTIVSGAVGR